MRYPMLWYALNSFLVVIALTGAPSAFAVTYKVLHAFSGTPDAGGLYSGLAIDKQGNLYGTSCCGGAYGYGTVFELSPADGGNWTDTILHSFCATFPQCSDGSSPFFGVTLDAAGNLYGTTSVIFRLSQVPDGWDFNVISNNGANGELLADAVDNVYAEAYPGACSGGFILKLKPQPDGGDWISRDLYDFCPDDNHYWPKGQNPKYGLSWDTAGNLYGIAGGGGKENQGLVFQLEHTPKGWKENVLHSFHYLNKDADTPYGGVVLDSFANVYGSTLQGGSDRCGGPGCGTIYKISKQPDGHWKETLLYRFPKWAESGGPVGTLAMDAAGNLYGVAGGGRGQCNCGVVFKFAHNPDDTWTYTILHRFKGTDGAYPQAGVILDAKGNIYGTTLMGGAGGAGVVFKITQ